MKGEMVKVVSTSKQQEKIRLYIRRCTHLGESDTFGASDPYVVVSLSGKICGKTTVVRNSLNPEWNNEYVDVVLPEDWRIGVKIKVQVYDWDSNAQSRYSKIFFR